MAFRAREDHFAYDDGRGCPTNVVFTGQAWNHFSPEPLHPQFYHENAFRPDPYLDSVIDQSIGHITYHTTADGFPQPESHYQAYQMEMDSSQDLIEQERLAAQYEPTHEGDLVSQRKSFQLLKPKYENGDPMFQVHIQYLEARFPAYRAMRGDGSCGWRAMFFGYFELLISTNDFALYKSEIDRLKDLCKLIPYEESIWEEWRDAALSLLVQLPSEENKARLLRSTFNDPEISPCLMSFLRSLATGWITNNESNYRGFIEDGQTVSDYCNRNINPVAAELEHLSLQIVYDMLFEPTGMAVDVYYLDRSKKDTVEPIPLRPKPSNPRANVVPIPTLNLLYQIGHYDILYSDSKDLIQARVEITLPSNYSIQPLPLQLPPRTITNSYSSWSGATFGPVSTSVTGNAIMPTTLPRFIPGNINGHHVQGNVPTGLPAQGHALKPGVMSQTAEERGIFRVAKQQLELSQAVSTNDNSSLERSNPSVPGSRPVSFARFVDDSAKAKEKRKRKKTLGEK